MNDTAGGIDLREQWSRFNEGLIRLVDYVPDDKLNWSPRPELWNFRGILLHIAAARDGWLGGEVQDGDPAPSVYQTTRSSAEIQREYRRLGLDEGAGVRREVVEGVGLG